jgi:putative flavoprotein involved in K+ transport
VRFEDDSKFEIDAVIWATGYRPDHSWIDLPVFGEDGRLRHRRGVTDGPGLYFLGLTWQHTRGSALIGWVKDDAEFIAERIARQDARDRSDSPTAAARQDRAELSARQERTRERT